MYYMYNIVYAVAKHVIAFATVLCKIYTVKI